MSVLNRIAHFQGRRDERPNQELAAELAENRDTEGIREIAQNLWHDEQNVRSDCLKVLYEVGYLQPELIADHAADFLKLLGSKNNRMVWGSMIALSTIGAIRADALFPHVAEIRRAIDRGSVITQVSGVKALAAVASANDRYRNAIFPVLLEQLQTCRPKDVPLHAENILPAVDATTADPFTRALEGRMAEMSKPGARRLKQAIAQAQKRATD